MLEPVRRAADAVGRQLRQLDVIAAWASATAREVGEEAFQRDPAFLAEILPYMRLMSRWFGAEVRGLENVPADGPVLLVGNHSGSILTPDTTVVFSAWYDRFGLDRPLVGLAFDAAFGIPLFRTLMRKIGEVPASHANAARALALGSSVLVYPGGDHEIFRPWTDRNRIDFAGRPGFVTLALRAGVPVVPVVAHGGHDSTLILTRGEWIGAMLNVARIRTRTFPIALQIPWGVSSVGLPGIPLPAKITVEIGAPMAWSHLGADAATDPVVVRRCYDEITSRMQATLTRLAAEHPWPLLSRLASLLPFEADGDGTRRSTWRA